MGMLEQLVADVAEIKAMLAGGTAAASTAPKAETAAQKKAREKAEAEAAAPKFSAEELRDKFLAVQQKFGDAAAKELIADCGYDKLAKLVADATTWQKSWDKAEAKLAEEAADADDGGL